MKSVNLVSLVELYKSLCPSGFKNVLDFYEIKVKESEVDCIESLINFLENKEPKIVNILNECFVGYNIPQISKEFDLLFFFEGSIVNVELKLKSDNDKILKQIRENRSYLRATDLELYSFTYEKNSDKLFFYKDGRLSVVDAEFFLKTIKSLVRVNVENVDSYFNPSDYLVSPFNSTEKFIGGNYFLTGHQKIIKKEIVDIVSSRKIKNHFFSIKAGAGTGKTLLAYDIAKSVMRNARVLILHCANLNAGHVKLKENDFEIEAIKRINHLDFESYSLIIVDEAQRLRVSQLNFIIEKVSELNNFCVFSYDASQTLSHDEKKANISGLISEVPNLKEYSLTDKIRTNEEVANFIKMFFHQRKDVVFKSKDNVDFVYFNDLHQAKKYAKGMSHDGWEVIRLTPNLHGRFDHKEYYSLEQKGSHEVIGQEFDDVCVIIDPYFHYDSKGSLSYVGRSYYDAEKMLFQNMTRARRKIRLIIVKNQEILNRCLSILQ